MRADEMRELLERANDVIDEFEHAYLKYKIRSAIVTPEGWEELLSEYRRQRDRLLAAIMGEFI